MEPSDGVLIFVIVALFAAAVTLLIIYFPRPPSVLLDKERKKVEILDVIQLSPDTKRLRISLGDKSTVLGLPLGKHILVYAPNPPSCVLSGKWNGKLDPDKGQREIDRKYTPVTGNETLGYVDLVVKIYRPGKTKMPDGEEVTWDDGGKVSLYLDGKKPGDFIEINGPLGANEYLGRGIFKLPGRTITVRHVGMLAGGTGITPMLQIVQASLRDDGDDCKFSIIYANKTEDDILCRDLLEYAVQNSKGRVRVHYTLDLPPGNWKHGKGFITQDMIKEFLPAPSTDSLSLMCGPPPMVQLACKKNLEALGWDRTKMVAF